DYCFKGSGYFLSDIEASHTGDVYLPGEEYYLLQAVERGHITDYDPQRDIIGYFMTVIIVPRGNPKRITGVRDFAAPGVKVGLGDPRACAVGRWHEKIFAKAGVWDEVQKNAVMNAKCIPELGNACQLGAVDATIVWAPLAILYMNDVDILPVETEYRGLVKLPVAVLRYAAAPAMARDLKAFLLSDEGKAVFRSHAYTVDPDPVDAEGFCLSGEKTNREIQWMQAGIRACRDKTLPVHEQTVGPLVEEVLRQRLRRR
ncbi:substrate-binding domain-containing protein, partial [candidate division FCPU426 bacterium]|nr:substrate-binding domain-containing protein [candidate division FCPU426 bacterium]